MTHGRCDERKVTPGPHTTSEGIGGRETTGEGGQTEAVYRRSHPKQAQGEKPEKWLTAEGILRGLLAAKRTVVWKQSSNDRSKDGEGRKGSVVKRDGEESVA